MSDKKTVDEAAAVKEVAATEPEKWAEVLVEKGDRKYRLLLPQNTTIGEAYDAAFLLLSKVVEIAKENAEKTRPKVEEPPKPEVK